MSTKIPFLDLGRLHESIRPELDAAYDRVLSGSGFVGAGAVADFEQAFAGAHDAPAAASCGSGTDALALALRAQGIGPGDEVVVPSMTFVATAEAVVHVGATPVLADVDPTSLLLTAETVDQARTARTRAVIAVHLFGHVVAPKVLADWRASGLVVVEDAAQAHLRPSRRGGRRLRRPRRLLLVLPRQEPRRPRRRGSGRCPRHRCGRRGAPTA